MSNEYVRAITQINFHGGGGNVGGGGQIAPNLTRSLDEHGFREVKLVRHV